MLIWAILAIRCCDSAMLSVSSYYSTLFLFCFNLLACLSTGTSDRGSNDNHLLVVILAVVCSVLFVAIVLTVIGCYFKLHKVYRRAGLSLCMFSARNLILRCCFLQYLCLLNSLSFNMLFCGGVVGSSSTIFFLPTFATTCFVAILCYSLELLILIHRTPSGNVPTLRPADRRHESGCDTHAAAASSKSQTLAPYTFSCLDSVTKTRNSVENSMFMLYWKQRPIFCHRHSKMTNSAM